MLDRKIGLDLFSLVSITSLLTACSVISPPRDNSTLEKINTELKQATSPREMSVEAVVPPAVSLSLLPPVNSKLSVPRASKKQLEQRFDLVVNDSPISQVLLGIVADTRYSIMIRPKNVQSSSPGVAAPLSVAGGMTDKVTINLKDITMFDALDAIREVYGYDYTIEGSRIYVQQPELQTRLYQVNYIIGQRQGVSDLKVIGGASGGGSSSSSGSSSSTGASSSGGSGSGSGYSSVQASALSTVAKSDIWSEVEDALRTTLGCQIPKKVAGSTGTGSAAGSGSAGATSRADVSFVGDTALGERQRGVDGCTDGRAMSINQMSGTIIVRGMPYEHRTVTQMLRSIQVNIERQVIIEAKIIDVELNSEAQQGINWASFDGDIHRSSLGADTTLINSTSYIDPATGLATTLRGSVNQGTSLGGLLGTGLVGASASNAFSAGLGIALQNRNFLAMLNFLQTQGHVHVLSSPRISTLNSQKAVIKVGSEEPFVTNIAGGSTSITNGVAQTTPPTLQYQPFFSGISLDVTPQIDGRDNITLHVHAMVNSVVEKEKISQPTAGAVRVPFAVNTISETDSVVKTKDGQVVVIGGLMTESNRDNRSKVPGVGDVPALGALFAKGGQSSVKRELVILLKPTVVKDDSIWTNDIATTQGRIATDLGGVSQPAPSSAPAQ